MTSLNVESYVDLKESMASIIFDMIDITGEIVQPENSLAIDEESCHRIAQSMLDLLEQERII